MFSPQLLHIFWFKQGGWKNKKLTEDLEMSAKVNEESIIEEGLQ